MAADVAYTLHVFPNHARALVTMTRLGERHHTDTPPGAKFTIDCYFQRAVRFRPDDTVVRSLYAQYLAKNGRKSAALAELGIAAEHAGENPFSHFNIGLLYFELEDYEHAELHAKKAKALGFPRTELIDRLKSKNHWSEQAEPR